MTIVGYIAVAAVIFLLAGMGIAVFGFYLWHLLRIIREVSKAVLQLQAATHELIGEGSFSRISKALPVISSGVPDILAGVKELVRVMNLVVDAGNAGKEPQKPAQSREVESGFYAGLSDETAAENEVTQEAQRQKLQISPEQFAGMHTDGKD